MTNRELYEDASMKEIGSNPNGTRMDVIYRAMDAAREDEAGKWEAQLNAERDRAGKLLEGLGVIAKESKDMTTILYATMLINQYNNKP